MMVVLHPDKIGEFRQDAAAKVKGISLNCIILGGPDNMQNLIGILTRCRRGRYLITADIKEFFYQIKLNKLDRSALRYLWWRDQTMQE